jgi:K+-transporting ATPase ATPase C chain
MSLRLIRPAVSLLVLMTLLLGIAYPLVIAGAAKVAFPRQAEGSFVYQDGKLIGSTLIGQSCSDPKSCGGRPSATTPQPYNGLGSTASNLGPLNPALIDAVKANAKALRDADPDNQQPIPVDLVTASASGLDPDVSPAAVEYQAARVARARHLELAQIEALIQAHVRERLFGIVGERRINVLELNLALDRLR